MTQTIRGIVFDKDGTLFDYQKTWADFCARLLAQLAGGDAALEAQLAQSMGYDARTGSFVTGSLIVNASAGEINAHLAAQLPSVTVRDIDLICLDLLDNLPNFPVCDLRQTLSALRDLGCALGVATNDYEKGAVGQLADAGITDLFDFVCGYDSGFGAKPEPGMILGFCDRLGLRADQVAMVGDSTHDLDAGRAACVGLNVGVLTGPAVAKDLQGLADVVLRDISDLPGYLAG